MVADGGNGEGSADDGRLRAIQERAIGDVLRRPHDWRTIRQWHAEAVRKYFSEKRDRSGKVIEIDLDATKGSAFLPYEQARRFHTVMFTVWRSYTAAQQVSAMARTLRQTPDNGGDARRRALLGATGQRLPFKLTMGIHAGTGKPTNPALHAFVSSFLSSHLAITGELVAAIQADDDHLARPWLDAIQTLRYEFETLRYDWYRWQKYQAKATLGKVKAWEPGYLQLSSAEAEGLTEAEMRALEDRNFAARLSLLDADPLGLNTGSDLGIAFLIEENVSLLSDPLVAAALGYRYRRDEEGDLVEPDLPLAIDHDELANLILGNTETLLARAYTRMDAEQKLRDAVAEASTPHDPWAGEPELRVTQHEDGQLSARWNVQRLNRSVDRRKQQAGNCVLTSQMEPLAALPADLVPDLQASFPVVLGHLGVAPERVAGTALEAMMVATALANAQLPGSLFSPPRFPGQPEPIYPANELNLKFERVIEANPAHGAGLLSRWLELAHANAEVRQRRDGASSENAEVQSLARAAEGMRFIAAGLTSVTPDARPFEDSLGSVNYTYEEGAEPFSLSPAARLIREIPFRHLIDFGSYLDEALGREKHDYVARLGERSQRTKAHYDAMARALDWHRLIFDDLVTSVAARLADETEEPDQNVALAWLSSPVNPESGRSATFSCISDILNRAEGIKFEREHPGFTIRSSAAVPAPTPRTVIRSGFPAGTELSGYSRWGGAAGPPQRRPRLARR